MNPSLSRQSPPEPSADRPALPPMYPVAAGVLAAIVTAALLAGLFHIRFGLNDPPSASGDEPSYDSIGWELSRGNGFAEDFRNPEFRQPYDALADARPGLMMLPELQSGTVTYRPPLFPMMIAAADVLSGRQFAVTRLLNVTAMSATAGLLVWFLLSTAVPQVAAGSLPTSRNLAALTAVTAWVLFLVVDVRVRLYARAILTEAGAVLLTAVLALLLLAVARRRRLTHSVAAGFIAGLMVLNRTAAALWIPTLVIGMLLLMFRHGRIASAADSTSRGRRPAVLLSAFLLTTVIAIAPWSIRNVVVLEAPMPLGAQGMMELPAGFSDRAWERGGLWFNLDHEGIVDADEQFASRLERERVRAERGRAAALEWIRENPLRTVVLGFIKIGQEYRPRSISEGLISVLAVFGLLWTCRRSFTAVFLVLHVANMLAIAATWSVEGRFVVPLLFTIHVWAACGCYAVLVQVVRVTTGR